MDRGAPFSSPRNLADELAPGRERAAERPLRQLEEQRGNGLVHLGEARQGEWLLARADRNTEEAVQPLVPAFLVGLHVAGGVESDAPARAPIGMHPQCRLLRHGPGGKEQRSLFAEQRRDLLLELGDDATDAVVVDLRPRRDQREQLVRGAASVAEEEARAGFGDRVELRVS